MKPPDLQPVRPRPQGLLEMARAAQARETEAGLIFLSTKQRTPKSLLRWLLRED